MFTTVPNHITREATPLMNDHPVILLISGELFGRGRLAGEGFTRGELTGGLSGGGVVEAGSGVGVVTFGCLGVLPLRASVLPPPLSF